MKVVLALISLFEGTHFSFPLANACLKANALKDREIEKSTEIELQHYRMQDQNNDIARKMLKNRPEIVAFSCYVWNVEKVLKASSTIKEQAPETVIVLGGPEVGPVAAEFLEKNAAADIIVKGEGEETFADLLRHFLGKGKGLQAIKGIAFREKGKVLETGDRPAIENLDEIASPYLSETIDLSKEKEAIVELSRGCAFNCGYCFDSKNFSGVRYHSIGRIKKELEYLAKFINLRRLYLMDSTFNLNRRRAVEICREVYKAFNGTVLIGTEVRAELMDAELAKWLKKINVDLLEVGLQSTNQETLQNINRQTDLKKLENGIKLLQKEGIRTQLDLIIGLPGDNLSTFKESLDYAISLKPSEILAFDLLVLPGTDLYRNADKFKLKFNPRPLHEVESNYSFSSDEIKRAREHAKRVLQEYRKKSSSKREKV